MKSRLWLTFFLLLALCAQIFARGKEETEIKTQNDEWILCVTNFDTSSLPEEKLSAAGVITRKIVERLGLITYRTRVSPEYAYYEGHAWARTRSSAAKALSAKQDERSLLVFRGEPSWKYKQNLAKIDTDIEKLRATLEEVEKEAPLINEEPVFKLTAGNLTSVFPAAPKEGSESKFCLDQKADAFLAGSIMDFYGRYYVSIKLYTLYTRSFVWEDSIVFSTDDLENALDEITVRMISVLSGNKPAVITVRAEPEETLVLINQTFAGKGETAPLEQMPGKITITASAPDYESLILETELTSGELAEVNIKLNPIEYGDVEITGYSLAGSVYHGALYVGETPMTLRLPLNMLEHIELETSGSQKGAVAFYTPEEIGITRSLSVRTAVPPVKGRVDSARRWYYWAWGGTWVTGIAAWIAFHSFSSSDTAVKYNYAQTNTYDEKFADDNVKMYYISMGTIVAVSAVALYGIFHMGRYIYLANKGSTPVVKPGRNLK